MSPIVPIFKHKKSLEIFEISRLFMAEDMVCEPLRLLLKFQRFRVTESGQTQCCPQRFHHTVISDIVLI